MLKQPICFVVMPYGKRVVEDLEIDFDVLFDDLIRPAAEAARFDVVRSDRELASGVILPRLFAVIYSADLVIADITYQNPNVYYELGVRHALRAQGTLLIRRIGGDLGVSPLSAPTNGGVADTAFDIQGITIWSYEATRSRLQATIDELRQRIERVASAVNVDSPAFLYLEGLKVVTGSPRAHARDDATYEILGDAREPLGRYVGYRSGDLKELKNERSVDFWVNSENVLMQMARIYERSVSATIRYLGALQPDPHAPDFDDTIAQALAAKLGSRHAVDPGEVVVTSSGRLRETHGVKAILHAAVVTGTPGRGYQSISDDLLIETARTVVATARTLIRSGDPEVAGRSLLMPLFGTGQARLDPNRNTERLLFEAIQDLSYHAANSDAEQPDLKAVLFSAFTKEHVTLLHRMLEALAAKGALRRVAAAGERKHAAAPASQ